MTCDADVSDLVFLLFFDTFSIQKISIENLRFLIAEKSVLARKSLQKLLIFLDFKIGSQPQIYFPLQIDHRTDIKKDKIAENQIS